MRLINTQTLQLEEFYGNNIPRKYAILSHTWDTQEVTFQQWQDYYIASERKGFLKIKAACEQAVRHGIGYLWADTNCIDKSSSAELSEAINSMFEWYRRATVCYAYLNDVPPKTQEVLTNETIDNICRSKWFTRGWTLQELLAPGQLVFYAQDWSKLGTRLSLASPISAVTRIHVKFLIGMDPLSHASVAQKMSWLSRRSTTRIEDMAYCMLGIFDINMPLLYGEGHKAFIRLQEEIIKVSNEHTIFCWTWTDAVPADWVSMLAPSPEVFAYAGDFVSTTYSVGSTRTFSMTNAGLSISLPLIQTWSYYLGIVNVTRESHVTKQPLCIPLWGHLNHPEPSRNDIMRRVPFPPSPLFADPSWSFGQPGLYVAPRFNVINPSEVHFTAKFRSRIGIVLSFGCTKELLNEKLATTTTTTTTTITARNLDDVYLMENTNDIIPIESYPPAAFGKRRGLLTLENRKPTYSGALLFFGQPGKSCLVFFGAWLDAAGQLRRVCQVLDPVQWGESKSDRKELLNDLITQNSSLNKDVLSDHLHNCKVVIKDSMDNPVVGRLSMANIMVGKK